MLCCLAGAIVELLYVAIILCICLEDGKLSWLIPCPGKVVLKSERLEAKEIPREGLLSLQMQSKCDTIARERILVCA